MGYQKGLKPLNIRWICAWPELASSPGLRGEAEGKGRPGDEARPERDRVYVYGRGLDGNLLSLTPFKK